MQTELFDLPTLLDEYDALSAELRRSTAPLSENATLQRQRDIVRAFIVHFGVEANFGVEIAAHRGDCKALHAWRAMYADPTWIVDKAHARRMVAHINDLLAALEVVHV